METLTEKPKTVSVARKEKISRTQQQVGNIDSDLDALHRKFDNLGTSHEKCVLDIKNNFEAIATLKQEYESFRRENIPCNMT